MKLNKSNILAALLSYLVLGNCTVEAMLEDKQSEEISYSRWVEDEGRSRAFTKVEFGKNDMEKYLFYKKVEDTVRSQTYSYIELIEENIELEKGITSIGSSCFYNCYLRSIKIPSTVTSIKASAFSRCSLLKEINIPPRVKIIGSSCFRYVSLTSITIPSRVLSIGSKCFQDCKNLQEVTIPNSVTFIGDYSFEYCNDLKIAEIPDHFTGLEEIKRLGINKKCKVKGTGFNDIFLTPLRVTENAYYSHWMKAKREGDIWENVRLNGRSVDEYKLKEQENVRLDEGITCIESSAFESSKKLRSIDIPSTVTSIGRECFNWCHYLSRINIESGLKSIGVRCFNDCSELSAMVIPDSVTFIGTGCFMDCTKLNSITLPAKFATQEEGKRLELKKDCFVNGTRLCELRLGENEERRQECNGYIDALLASVKEFLKSYDDEQWKKVEEATDKIWSISQKSQTSEKEVLVKILKECAENNEWTSETGRRKIEELRNDYNRLFNK